MTARPEVGPAEPALPARACLRAPPPPRPSRWMSRTPPGPPRSRSVDVRAITQAALQPPLREGSLSPWKTLGRSFKALQWSFHAPEHSVDEARRWRSREGLTGGDCGYDAACAPSTPEMRPGAVWRLLSAGGEPGWRNKALSVRSWLGFELYMSITNSYNHGYHWLDFKREY